MPIIRISKVTSTKFVDELKARARSFRTTKVAARLQVPSDLSFWYWLEFGTATRRSPEAPYGGGTSSNYLIKPIQRGDSSTLEALHWGPEGGGVFAAQVMHPGIRPHPFVRPALNKIMQQFGKDLAAAFADGGFRTNVIRETLMNETMVFAKALIVKNLASAAPGTRPDGHLLGQTAAEVFDEESEIVSADDFSPGAIAAFNSRKDQESKPKRPRKPKAVTPSQLLPKDQYDF
jgi:hypothetical protein